jgi:hypothetical protein
MVKYWSNTGQILVRYWSDTGQMVKYATPPHHPTPPPPDAAAVNGDDSAAYSAIADSSKSSNIGQMLVKYWSNASQTRSPEAFFR